MYIFICGSQHSRTFHVAPFAQKGGVRRIERERKHKYTFCLQTIFYV